MLTIAVLAYHKTPQTALTDECVTSIDASILPDIPVEKVIIDNGSIPLLKPYKGWKTARIPHNIGNIGGQNTAIMVAQHEWVLFVSNDVRVELTCIIGMWEMRRNYAQLMPTILNPNGTIQSIGGKLVYPGYGCNLTSRGELDYVPSIIYLMRKELWRNCDGFDEAYPMTYEDVDMGKKLRSFVCAENCRAIHLGNTTLQYTNNKPFRLGRRMFIKKHYKGVDRWLRLMVMNVLDAITAVSSRFAGKS